MGVFPVLQNQDTEVTGSNRLLGALDWILRQLILFLRARSTLPGHMVVSGAN